MFQDMSSFNFLLPRKVCLEAYKIDFLKITIEESIILYTQQEGLQI